MKVTIDSTEPLADALRVIGALYEVNLNVVDDSAVAGAKVPAVASNGTARRASSTKGPGRRQNTSSRQTRRIAQSASVSEIRTWARDHGHQVSNRGTLPAAIKAAYAEAHGG